MSQDKEQFVICVCESGELKFIYSDLLQGMFECGVLNVQRVSHVEPKGALWFADMSPVNGPMLGPYKLRSEALEAEVNWLRENLNL